MMSPGDDVQAATLTILDREGAPVGAEWFTEAAKTLLKSQGYVVHRAKSWRRLVERVRVAEALTHYAQECHESIQRWAETTLHNQIRDLSARCTFLYGMARAKGATVEELAGGGDAG